jgi:hypothetical protein
MGVENTYPAQGLVAVTPSDSTTLNFRGLYIGVTGNVAILSAGRRRPSR